LRPTARGAAQWSAVQVARVIARGALSGDQLGGIVDALHDLSDEAAN
jgi:hypothetical protein